MSIAVKSGLPSLGSTEGAVITKDDISVTEETSPSASVGEDLPRGKSAYEVAVENGFSGTETEWLASLKGATGAPGADGRDGEDGKTPYVGDNGNWYIGTDDTGKPSRGAKGDKGEKGEKGDTGAQGEPGKDGRPGAAGAPGATGTTFTPSVSADGTLSWTNDGGKTNPDSVNIKGPQGNPGEKGNPGETGAKGADGVTPTIGANGNWYLEDTDTGKPSRGEKGDKGDPGAQGPAGATPVKGTDYFTAEDKAALVQDVLAALPEWTGGNY